MARVQFPDSAGIWAEFVVVSHPCYERFFSRFSGFPSLLKNQHFQIPIGSEVCTHTVSSRQEINAVLHKFKNLLLHGMPAGHDVSRFRSGIFFFIGVINVHINLCIKLCPPLVRIYCSDCLQQKRPNQNLFFRHISRERGPTHHFCVTSNHHLIYSLKLD